jgi:pyrimidine-nucleoside phosphorylase/thymidine phosphorylase
MACLMGGGPSDLRELCVVLAGQVLRSAGLPGDEERVARALDDGSAYQRFELWIEAQGGDPSTVTDLPLAPDQELVRAQRSGTVSAVEARAVGRAAGLLGGGRSRKGDALDHGVGVLLHAKVGDTVSAGEALATVYHRGGRGLAAAREALEGALEVADSAVPQPLIIETGLG